MPKKWKRRQPNFRRSEREILLPLITANSEIVENKKVDLKTMKQKYETWKEIEYNFNSISDFTYRSAEDLKKAWKNIKRKPKIRNTPEPEREAVNNPDESENMEIEGEGNVALPAEGSSGSSVAVQQSSPETAEEGNGGNAHEVQLQKFEKREIKKKILQLKLATEIEILKQTKINTKIAEIELEEKLASKSNFN